MLRTDVPRTRSTAARPDTQDLWRDLITLSAQVLSANSATRALEKWCQDRGIGTGTIRALVNRSATPQSLDDDSLDALGHPAVRSDIVFREVRLVTGDVELITAFNWYLPGNLTPEMRTQLQTTDTPFGCVVAPLSPRRRTFCERRQLPAHPFDFSQPAFEHHALVARSDGVPLAVVHEHFLWNLFP
jgi:hypothetical protein